MGSSKGKVAEREVARLLSEWWGPLEPGAQFVRTPCSGGWSSREVRTGFRASGDIMTTAVRFPFTVESKRREGWSPANFVKGRRSPVWAWWRQALREAVEQNLEPMLWVRRTAGRVTGAGTKGGTAPPAWLVLVRASLVPKIGIHPDLAWFDHTLVGGGVDFGGELPVGYMARRLLALDPVRVAL